MSIFESGLKMAFVDFAALCAKNRRRKKKKKKNGVTILPSQLLVQLRFGSNNF
jgi:hypothetical protein